MGITSFLEKFKLIKIFDNELSIHKLDFIYELEKITYQGYYSSIFAVLDVFIPNKKKFIGNINDNHYKIRKSYKFFNLKLLNSGSEFTIICADFLEEKEGKLKVKTKIQGMSLIPFLLRIVILIIYFLLMIALIIEALIPPITFDMAFIFPPIFVTIFVFLLAYLPLLIAKGRVATTVKMINTIYKNMENSD